MPSAQARGTGASAELPGSSDSLDDFRTRVYLLGRGLYRDLPWRRTRDPYAVWVSEAMLQPTQVSRVDGRWQRWLERFPTPDALAAATSADVLDEWQGLGYNRRALALWNAARVVSETYAGELPRNEADLLALPGIGPATASGIRAFAFDEPGVYLETNVRAVFLHELFPEAQDVPGADALCTPRSWYYALLDYGFHLKKTIPNPSRRSRSNVRQSAFEGSHRQKRAAALRVLLAARAAALPGVTAEEVARALSEAEVAAGRPPVDSRAAAALLDELADEGFCRADDGAWMA